jgi:hypothetical protein
MENRLSSKGTQIKSKSLLRLRLRVPSHPCAAPKLLQESRNGLSIRLTAERSTIELPGNLVTLLQFTDGFNFRFSATSVNLNLQQLMHASEMAELLFIRRSCTARTR